jgi:hypothetical protein
MKIYPINDANFPVSQAYRPQLERFFYDGNIYVVEAAADYPNLPQPVLDLLKGRKSTAFLKSPSFYPMYYKGLLAKFLVHPETDLTTMAIDSNGTTALGVSATVGKANRVYSIPGEIVSRIEPTDATVAHGYRGEIFSPVLYAQKLAYNTPYNIAVGLKLCSWDFASNLTARMIIFQVRQTEDPGDYSGIPPLFLSVIGSKFRISYAYNDAAITTGPPTERILYEFNATSDQWVYFGFRAIFNYTGQGHLDAYVNGSLVGRYDGSLGYNDRLGNFAKMGCYDGAGDGFPSGVASREIHYKGCIVIEEKAGYSLPDMYADLQAV